MKPRIEPEPLQRWVLVNESSSPSDTFIGTPSLIIDSIGTFWAAHNWFGAGTSENTTLVWKSTDSGATWSLPTAGTITGMYRARLFEYGEDLYLLGMHQKDLLGGNLKIVKSTDGFETTPSSTTIDSTLEWGTTHSTYVVQDGYFLTAAQDRTANDFAQHNRLILVWADLDNLMTAGNWGWSTPLAYSQSDNLANWSGTNSGWLEPMLVNDGGTLKVITRMHTLYEHKAAKLNVSWTPATPTGSLTFTPTFVDVPGGSIQFVPIWHSGASKWLIVSNHEADFTPGSGSYGVNDPQERRWEQWLCSASTVDGTWTPELRIHGSDYEKMMGGGVGYCGFQYASSQLSSDEDTLYVLNRTSWQGADSEHNANRLTFETYRGINALLGV
jgi:hypothetical protein